MADDRRLAANRRANWRGSFATGAVSPVEVLDAHLAAIAELNPKLNAIVTLAAEAGARRARALPKARS